MSVTVTPLTSAVGAEIGNVDLVALSDADFAQIEQAWHRYCVLLFREQKLTDDDLLAFSRRFGELDPPPNQEHGRQSPPGYPDVYVVSNVLDDKGEPIGALGAGEAVWHTDMSYPTCRRMPRCCTGWKFRRAAATPISSACRPPGTALPAARERHASRDAASSTTAPTTAAAMCAKA